MFGLLPYDRKNGVYADILNCCCGMTCDICCICEIEKSRLTALSASAWNRKYDLEILSYQIGKGLYLGHAHNISVNPNAVIGDNCNLNKGVTIGAENRGSRKGAPIGGNCVWVGTNSTVVSRITIGDDVLIAANAFVNMDVPSHSLVIGNPAVIYPRKYATEGYICNKV